METAYYVTHPNLDQSAMVYAPSTDKARTVFLDWLERNSTINRSDRGNWRRNMIAEKMEEPASVNTDVELWYGYESSDGNAPLRSIPTFSKQLELPLGDVEESLPVEEEEEKPIRPISPIARISLGRSL